MSKQKLAQIVLDRVTPHLYITQLEPGCEFRLGDAVAYGEFSAPEYSVDHAPSQEQLDAIAAYIDAESAWAQEQFDRIDPTHEAVSRFDESADGAHYRKIAGCSMAANLQAASL